MIEWQLNLQHVVGYVYKSYKCVHVHVLVACRHIEYRNVHKLLAVYWNQNLI